MPLWEEWFKPELVYNGTQDYNQFIKEYNKRLQKYGKPHISGDELNYQQINHELNQNGYVILKNMFPKDLIIKLRNELDYYYQTTTNLSKNDEYFSQVKDPYINSKYTLPIALDDRLIKIVTNYFGCIPGLGTCNLRVSHINNLPDRDTLLFHNDANTANVFKFFLYLDDVKEIGHGPFTYVEGSHRNKFPGFNTKYRRTDQDIISRYGEDRIKYLTADSGDVIVGLTSGYHKGTKVSTKSRKMFTINWGVHSEGNEYKIRQSDYNKLTPLKRATCDFMKKV